MKNKTIRLLLSDVPAEAAVVSYEEACFLNEPTVEIRNRRTSIPAGGDYKLILRSEQSWEEEIGISELVYANLKHRAVGGIQKIVFEFWEEGRRWEISRYDDQLTGLVIAELVSGGWVNQPEKLDTAIQWLILANVTNDGRYYERFLALAEEPPKLHDKNFAAATC